MARVVVGLSGGVDSSVAAHLLKEQGHEVIGIFMRNWNDSSPTLENECPWIEDSRDAMMVAEHLGIPFQLVDFSKEYLNRIVNYMFAEYKAGRTPNPDILCNREIKFDLFLKEALKLKADFVATGHYVQKTTTFQENKDIHHLVSGADSNKNQAYFLCQLSQKQLAKSLFPIGHLDKPEVRKIAETIGLPTANKKDSQGLCFIGHVRLPDFLQQKLKPKQGAIIEIDVNFNEYKKPQQIRNKIKYMPENGRVVGTHQGAHYFTVGQRKGLNVGGTPLPLFVLQTDIESNSIYVGQGADHPGLKHLGTIIQNKDVHWIQESHKMSVGDVKKYQVQIRYRQEPFEATLKQKAHGLEIHFDQHQNSVAPGQFAAWFFKNELIGSGVMSS